MKRITTQLMTAGALALAGCSGGGEAGGNNAAANTAGENVGADSMANDPNSSYNAAGAGPDVTAASAAPTKENPGDSAAPIQRLKVTPKAAPAPRPAQPKQATPKPAPKSEPSQPPKAECSPEHRAAGHC